MATEIRSDSHWDVCVVYWQHLLFKDAGGIQFVLLDFTLIYLFFYQYSNATLTLDRRAVFLITRVDYQVVDMFSLSYADPSVKSFHRCLNTGFAAVMKANIP